MPNGRMLAGGGLRLRLLALLNRKAPDQSEDSVNLLVREISAECGHVAAAILNHPAQIRVRILLNQC